MPKVSSVDYVTKRIYLSAETVNTTLDTLDVYREVRGLRLTTEEHRKFKPMVVTGGNIQKTATTYTQPYVQLLYGCRIVPYDSPHYLRVIRDTFSDDGQSGVGCFDRTGVVSNVDINYDVDKVEVREVLTGGSTGPTASEIASAVLSAAQLNPIYADTKKMNGATIQGDGTVNNKWRGDV